MTITDERMDERMRKIVAEIDEALTYHRAAIGRLTAAREKLMSDRPAFLHLTADDAPPAQHFGPEPAVTEEMVIFEVKAPKGALAHAHNGSEAGVYLCTCGDEFSRRGELSSHVREGNRASDEAS